MYPDYKNWVPKGMIKGLTAGAALLAAGSFGFGLMGTGTAAKLASAVCGAGAVGCGAGLIWSVMAYNAFSYDGKRQLSREVVEGTAKYITLPEGGVGLDVGCGSGALTIACAKRNPHGRMVGIDRWGADYASFSLPLCEKNAAAEGAANTSFQKGNALKLDFPDESFDAVTSNYVYHNIPSRNRQEILLETLRVLKKGGVFAIHDIFSKPRYGDMEAFARMLTRELGYESAELIDTTGGMFMTRGEALRLGLSGSALLVGRK